MSGQIRSSNGAIQTLLEGSNTSPRGHSMVCPLLLTHWMYLAQSSGWGNSLVSMLLVQGFVEYSEKYTVYVNVIESITDYKNTFKTINLKTVLNINRYTTQKLRNVYQM